MLRASHLTYEVGSKALLTDVSADFDPASLHIIVGPNGAGKSTLIKLLSRVWRSKSGQLLYGEKDVLALSDRELATRRAILSQVTEIAFPITVEELVMMGRYPHFRGRPSAKDIRICNEVMTYFEVTEFAGRQYGTLSGGERQRVSFARVLAQIWEPVAGSDRYLFLDEPLVFLDIRHQIDFMQKVRNFAAQKDVVAVGVVHDLHVAAKFANRLLLLDRGRILAAGHPKDVLTPDNLLAAFGLKPRLLRDPLTEETHLIFD